MLFPHPQPSHIHAVHYLLGACDVSTAPPESESRQSCSHDNPSLCPPTHLPAALSQLQLSSTPTTNLQGPPLPVPLSLSSDPSPYPDTLPDTDPAYIDALWHYVRRSLRSLSDTLLLPHPLLPDNMTIAQPTLKSLLSQYGIEIRDINHGIDLFGQIRTELRQAQAPRDSGVNAWGTTADVDEAYLRDLAVDAGECVHPLVPFRTFQAFIEEKIFSPRGVRHTFDPVIFEVTGKGYDLPPIQDSVPLTSVSEQNVPPSRKPPPSTSQSKHPKSERAPLRGLATPSHRSSTPSQSTNPPTSLLQPTSKLSIQTSYFDFGYFVDATTTFGQDLSDIALQVFVTKASFNKPRATLPYLSVAFEDMPQVLGESSQQRKTRVSNKLATYGAVGLYNRFQLFESAKRAQKEKNLPYNEHSTILHFGVEVFVDTITLYYFELKETSTRGWTGCNMRKLFASSITHSSGLSKLFQHLDDIYNWGELLYVEWLKKDVKCLVDGGGL